VLCNTGDFEIEHENVEVLDSIEKLEEYINSEEEHFVIGGGMIYRLLMERANKLYITKINEDFEGDAFFPEIDMKIWEEIERKPGLKDEKNPYDYEYITYCRKKQN